MAIPASIIGVAFGAGILIQKGVNFGGVIIGMEIGISILGYILDKKRRELWLILWTIGVGGGWWEVRRRKGGGHYSNFLKGGEIVECKCRIKKIEEWYHNKIEIMGKVEEIKIRGRWSKSEGKIRIILNHQGDDRVKNYFLKFAPQEIIRVKGEFREYKGEELLFPERKYFLNQQIYGEIVVSTPFGIKLVSSGFSPLSRVRKFIQFTITKYLDWEIGSFLRAVTLRERKLLHPTVKEEFFHSGAGHILATSGLHVGIVWGLIFFILSVFRVPFLLKQGLGIIGVIAYIYIVLPSPPIVRAGMMSILGMIAYSMEREVSMLNLIGVAGLGILIFAPNSLFDPSFQLSFSVIIGLTVMYPFCVKFITFKPQILNYLVRIIFLTLVSQMFSFPFLLYHFHRFPIFSFFTNIVVIPLTIVSIWLTFLMCLFESLSLHLFSQLIASCLWGVSSLVLTFVEWSGKGWKYTGGMSVYFLVFYYYVLVFFLSFPKLPPSLKSKVLLLFLMGVNFFAYQKLGQRLARKIEIIGKNEKGKVFMFIKSNSYTTLINTGKKRHSIRTLLVKHRVKELNCCILTGESSFEIGEIEEVVEGFNVNEIVLPNKIYKNKKWVEALKKIREKKVNTKIIKNITGIEIKLGKISLITLQKPAPTNFQYGAILLPYDMEFRIILKEKNLTIE